MTENSIQRFLWVPQKHFVRVRSRDVEHRREHDPFEARYRLHIRLQTPYRPRRHHGDFYTVAGIGMPRGNTASGPNPDANGRQKPIIWSATWSSLRGSNGRPFCWRLYRDHHRVAVAGHEAAPRNTYDADHQTHHQMKCLLCGLCTGSRAYRRPVHTGF